MAIHFTSDLHFQHKNILEYTDRPFSTVEEMDEALIHNWNSRVNDHDIVYVLGDLTLAPYSVAAPLIMRLRGTKILIKGNHDHFSHTQYAKLGFKLVYDEIAMTLFGKKARLSHYPPLLRWYRRLKAYKSELRFPDKRPLRQKGEIILHGHTHTKKIVTAPNLIHVGVDAHNFKPVSLKELERIIAKRKELCDGA